MSEKVVWITGASTGIGFESAKAFAKSGYIVVATARRKSRLVALVNEIKFTGHEAYAFVCNVQSERSVLSTKKKILEKCGTIDIIVNNAGVTVFKSLLDTKSYEFDYIMDTNLRGSFLMIKAVLPLMIKKKEGTSLTFFLLLPARHLKTALYMQPQKQDCLRLQIRCVKK